MRPRAKVAFQPLVTNSISQQVSEKIRESIVNGRFKVNDRLPTEEELATQFNVSRPTIREALKRLAAQHLVRSRRGPTGGTFVCNPTIEDLSANLTTVSTMMVSLGEFEIDGIIEARQELEILCATLAAKRRSPQHIETLEREIEIQKGRLLSDVEFCASDVRFHRVLVEASENSVLRFLMYAVIEALQPVENMIIFRFRERQIVVKYHEQIVSALKARNSTKARSAVVSLMKYIRSQFAAAERWRGRRAMAAVAGSVGDAR